MSFVDSDLYYLYFYVRDFDTYLLPGDSYTHAWLHTCLVTHMPGYTHAWLHTCLVTHMPGYTHASKQCSFAGIAKVAEQS